MPFLRQGEKPPEVTMPTSAPDSSRSAVPSRTGAPWSTTKPHRARVRDLSRSSARMRSEPQKEPSSARRRLAITHASAPSTGDVVSSRSLPTHTAVRVPARSAPPAAAARAEEAWRSPYKQRPASRRRESRAPSPTGVTSSLSSSVLQSPRTACCDPPPGGTAISNPSSPVYLRRDAEPEGRGERTPRAAPAAVTRPRRAERQWPCRLREQLESAAPPPAAGGVQCVRVCGSACASPSRTRSGPRSTARPPPPSAARS